MPETWIKLYRKILQNDGLFRSSHTFTVWCWLLLMADYKTGIVKCGRFQISQWLKIKPTTVYQTLKRLSNMTMIEMKSDNKMTTITILNWNQYQMNCDNKMTTNGQQSDTIQEYKNKEVKNNTTQKVNKYPLRESVTEVDMVEIAKRYKVPLDFVVNKFEDVCNWEDEKPGRMKGRNWRLTLIRWVKNETIKRITPDLSIRKYV